MTMDFIGRDYRRAECGARALAAGARHESQSKMMLAQVGRASAALLPIADCSRQAGRWRQPKTASAAPSNASNAPCSVGTAATAGGTTGANVGSHCSVAVAGVVDWPWSVENCAGGVMVLVAVVGAPAGQLAAPAA